MIISLRRMALLLLLMAVTSITCTAQQRGKASYYAHKFHGRITSSGRPYHKDSMFCAHRTYPFGTLLKVTNLRNNRSVIVKVVDRGPFAAGRIVDLSYAAAEKLGMIRSGIANVIVSVYKGEDSKPAEPEKKETKKEDIKFDAEFSELYNVPWLNDDTEDNTMVSDDGYPRMEWSEATTRESEPAQ